VIAEPNSYKLTLFTTTDNELSIAPDGSIWIMMPLGMLYFTENPETTWLSVRFNLDLVGLTKRITWIDSQTALITGSIKVNGREVLKRTVDRGRNWIDVPFEEDTWIYDVFSNFKGEVWMGGSSGEIYFSADKGATWEKRNSPFNKMTWMAAIFMSDMSSGIAGALDNLLFATRDNWQTSERLPTPLDQGYTYGKEPRYLDGRFFQVACWRGFYLADQCGIICHTRKDKINWKAFPERLLTFSIDPVSARCFGVTQTLKPVELVSDGENIRFLEIGQKPLPARPLEIKAFDSALYILDEDVYICRVSDNKFLRKPIMVLK